MDPITYKSSKEIAAAYRRTQCNHRNLITLYEEGKTNFDSIAQSAKELKRLKAAYTVTKEEERYGIA